MDNDDQMNKNPIPASHPAAGIYMHDRFILVQTKSGYGAYWNEPDGDNSHLKAKASASELGDALIRALAKSKIFTVDNYPRRTLANISGSYESWVANLMQRHRFETRRALFKSLKNVGVDQYHGQLILRPKRHEKLEAWSATPNWTADWVTLPYPNDPVVIGEAIRLAQSRCC